MPRKLIRNVPPHPCRVTRSHTKVSKAQQGVDSPSVALAPETQVQSEKSCSPGGNPGQDQCPTPSNGAAQDCHAHKAVSKDSEAVEPANQDKTSSRSAIIPTPLTDGNQSGLEQIGQIHGAASEIDSGVDKAVPENMETARLTTRSPKPHLQITSTLAAGGNLGGTRGDDSSVNKVVLEGADAARLAHHNEIALQSRALRTDCESAGKGAGQVGHEEDTIMGSSETPPVAPSYVHPSQSNTSGAVEPCATTSSSETEPIGAGSNEPNQSMQAGQTYDHDTIHVSFQTEQMRIAPGGLCQSATAGKKADQGTIGVTPASVANHQDTANPTTIESTGNLLCGVLPLADAPNRLKGPSVAQRTELQIIMGNFPWQLVRRLQLAVSAFGKLYKNSQHLIFKGQLPQAGIEVMLEFQSALAAFHERGMELSASTPGLWPQVHPDHLTSALQFLLWIDSSFDGLSLELSFLKVDSDQPKQLLPPTLIWDYDTGKYAQFTQTMMCQARLNPSMWPGSIEAGQSTAFMVLQGWRGAQRCLTCHFSKNRDSRGRSCKSLRGSGPGFLQTCRCPVDTALIELWLAKLTSGDPDVPKRPAMKKRKAAEAEETHEGDSRSLKRRRRKNEAGSNTETNGAAAPEAPGKNKYANEEDEDEEPNEEETDETGLSMADFAFTPATLRVVQAALKKSSGLSLETMFRPAHERLVTTIRWALEELKSTGAFWDLRYELGAVLDHFEQTVRTPKA
ncbi:hypothetical protein CERSUDRAFT_99043 [Gelatoporia subvermispora B]|uniref:Uncharacterized protein n=1 Tax=Ceriporiopsis subvermispora (strain B) TaxID=914234 RepID=M2R4A1_CERS8|nr:hypothetical protein CERSUDRAFT_99043 [Gelatoporia subvermispora B]